MNRCLLVLFIALLGAGPAVAQGDVDKRPSFSMGGLAFGDFYGIPSHHLREGNGSAGLWIRRGYLTFDGDFSDRWFGRLRFELNQAGGFEVYTFSVHFKDLYAGLRLGEHTILFGLSSTPTIDLIEDFWGARYLARTPLDMQGVASRDTGVAIQGPINAEGSLSYRTMVGAGIKFGNESGDGRKWMGALNWRPSERWFLDLYADYEILAGDTNRRTLQAFLGYDSCDLRGGLQYSNQDRQEDAPLELVSAFVVRRLAEDTSLIGRVDYLFEPSPKGNDITYLPFDPCCRATLVIGAVEFLAHEHLTLTPNVLAVVYARNDEGVKPPSDVYLRITFFIDLE